MGFLQVLTSWREDARKQADGHRRAARRLDRMHYTIGVPTVVVSAVVATTVFASIENNVALWAKLVVALFSVGAAVMSALQTFLRYQTRAEQHRVAEAELDRHVGEIETLLATPPKPDEHTATLKDLNDRRAEIKKAAPPIAARDSAPGTVSMDVQQAS